MPPAENRPTWQNHPGVTEPQPWPLATRVASWIWALAPFLTIGLANPVVFLYAAVRRQTTAWRLAFGAYAVATVLLIWLAGAPDGSPRDNAAGTIGVINWLVGGIHALVTRRRVFQPAEVVDLSDEPAIARALQARERRDLAREILAEDPRLASDLGIGRPDLGRGYDDGGVVDVNSAPVEVIARLPGVGPEQAAHIVAVRQSAGGFSSAEDLAVLADLPPAVADAVREYVVFSPR